MPYSWSEQTLILEQITDDETINKKSKQQKKLIQHSIFKQVEDETEEKQVKKTSRTTRVFLAYYSESK